MAQNFPLRERRAFSDAIRAVFQHPEIKKVIKEADRKGKLPVFVQTLDYT